MISPGDGAASGSARFRFNVLGPFEASYDQRAIELTGVARSVLAVLTASPGRMVSVGAIVAGLWGTEPPDGAERAVASYVSRLRKVLGGTAEDVDATAVVVTRPPGYVLAVPPTSVDAVAFETGLEQGRRAAAAGQPALAADRYGQALALWRGAAYAEFADHPFAQRQRARLDELRVVAVEARIDALLAAGSPAGQLVADLEGLVDEHPHRERMWVQLMTALYRDGRQADALDAYRRARTAMVEQLGVEPGPALREAERAVLVGDDRVLAVPVPRATEVPDELARGAGVCVGRDDELSWLTAQLDAAAFEGGRACLVAGPDGIGKTRLVAELAERAAERGVTVRYGSGGRGVEALTAGAGLRLVILDDVERLDDADRTRVDAWLRAATDRPVLTVLTCGTDMPPAPFAALPRLELTPLTPEQVATVIRIYSPDVPDSTVSEIAEHAGGVPARVHHAVRDWAAARAGRRVGQAVIELSDRRRRIEAARESVVAGVLEVGRVRAQSGAYGGPGQPTVACPYKGLARFERADAEFFHGRDRLVAELVARLVDAPLVAVVGASGSGKSSVVRAGLLAALRDGTLPGSGGWRQVVVTPAAAPPGLTEPPGLAESPSLAEPPSLADPSGRRTILVLDQFEEAFTVLPEDARTALVERIVAEVATGTTTVVLAVRADYYARCAEHPTLGRLVTANTVLVPQMAADELRQAIERPAALAGLRIEDGLVDLLVDQARDAPGGLPLLSVALLSLWERRSGRSLTVGGFRDSGGVAGSVERLGEQAFADLRDDQHRDAARRMLLRLAGSADGETVTARRTDLDDLAVIGGPVAGEVLDVLVGRRLVSVTDEHVEVAHEALFTHWSRLRGWLADDASGRALRGHLTPAARAWAAADRDPGELYRGARLAAMLDWAATRADEMVPIEREFLDAGRAAAVADQVRQRRNVRRLRTVLVAAVAALAVAVAGAVVAVDRQQSANAASRVADAERMSSQALLEPDLPRAMLLAAAATRLDDNWQTRGNLLATLLRTPDLVHAAKINEADRIQAQAISPDGRLIAVAGAFGAIRVFDATTLRPVETLTYPAGPVRGMSFTSDSTRLVTWGGGVTTGTFGQLLPAAPMVVWDLASGQQVGVPFGLPFPEGGALLADDRTVVVVQTFPRPVNATTAQILSPKPPPKAFAWDLRTRRRSQLVHLPDVRAGSVNASTDRRKVLIDGPGGITVVDAATGSTRLLRGVHGFPALSPDGHTLAVTDPDGPDVAVWDLATGKLKGVARGHSAGVGYIAWSPDGSTFTSASDDASAIVWDAATLAPRLVLTGDTGAVLSAGYSPDGRTVYTSGQDGMLLEWDITGSRTLDQLVHTGVRPLKPIDPLGYNAATQMFYFDVPSPSDVTVRRVDARTGTEAGAPIRLDADTNVIQISPNGRYLSVSYGDNGGQVFDALSGRPLTGRIHTFGTRARFAETDPTGRILAVAGRDDDFHFVVELFDIASGKRIGDPLSLTADNGGLRFSPDGRYLVSGMSNGRVAVFDVESHRLVTELPVYPALVDTNVVEFSPDGRLLAVGGDPGQVSAWHVGSWTRAWTANVVTSGRTGFISFSPDGRLVSVDGGQKLLLFDAATGQAIGTPLTTDWGAGFALDGKSVLVMDSTAGVHRFDIDPRSWVRRACDIAGRDLTADEWQRYAPGRQRVPVCPTEP
ncbi:MAG TPA: BTAD domain-containing putative transcriptional regulator [Micromonosporaceae bacterium]|nr:BTAD domain-containing putative transcriptional regulator [Micromonosporaceae bacterium]